MRYGRGDFVTQCFGKTKYHTKAKAIDRIHHQMDNRRRKRRCRKGSLAARLEPYHCCYCGFWHVGQSIKIREQTQAELERRVAKDIDRMLHDV